MGAYLIAKAFTPKAPRRPDQPEPPPAPPPAPPVPEFAPEPTAQAEMAETRRRERRRTGLESTVRTSPLGVPVGTLGMPVRARQGV